MFLFINTAAVACPVFDISRAGGNNCQRKRSQVQKITGITAKKSKFRYINYRHKNPQMHRIKG